jgi:REP element-mobilizing transposase RayT
LRLGWWKYSESLGYRLPATGVHDGDHVHVFVSAKTRICIPEMARMLKYNSAKALFEELPMIKLQLWGEHLWSDGYAVRTAGVVTSEKIEQYMN